MTSKFDWQTEEDGEWESTDHSVGVTRKSRRWLWAVAIVVALVLAAGAVLWQVRERVSSAEAARSNDIISSFNLIRQAAESNDAELFRNLLSGSDLQWASIQQALFAEGWLFDLSAFGLDTYPTQTTDVEVSLSPELDSAEVVAVATYRVRSMEPFTDTINLRQTSVFRRGERWIWSPPKDAFWGELETAEGQYVSIAYPARDEELVRRLLDDLDRIVAQMCAEVEHLDCIYGMRLHLSLSRDPAALLELTERFVTSGYYGTKVSGRVSSRFGRPGGLELTLPTPSLIGLPVDHAGYQALLRGYGAHLAIGLAQRLVDADCCGSEARFRAAIQVMLRDLGLRELTQTVDSSREIGQMPQNQVALLCSDGFERRQRMLLLDLEHGAWLERSPGFDLWSVKTLPGGDGVLLLGQSSEDKRLRSQVWRMTPDGSTLIFDIPVSPAEAARVSWELQERPGRLVIEVPNLRQGFSRYFTLDLSECAQGACLPDPQSTVSRPVWSPDGNQLVVHAYGLLWWRYETTMVPVADAAAPFWVDNDTYGFVRTIGPSQAVVLVDMDSKNDEKVALTTEELGEALEPEAGQSAFVIGRVLVPPGVGYPWLILAFAEGQAHFFSYEPDTGRVALVPHQGRLLSFNMSPSGRRLATAGFNEETSRWQITVTGQDLVDPVNVDLNDAGSADAVPSYSWSNDEQWLLILEQGQITLLNPASNLLQRIVPPEPGCVQAAWYARGVLGAGEGARSTQP